MKKLLYTITGVIGTIIITILFNQIFGLELQSFSLWFVIPVGGIYVGLGAVSGLYYYLFKHESVGSLNWKVYMLSLFLGFTTFLGIYYASYLISSYEFEGLKISFIQYLQIKKISGESYFAVGGIPAPQGIDVGKDINTIYFYLQILGVILGSLWAFCLKIWLKINKEQITP